MSTQVPDNYCGHCGEPLAPGATTCARCNTPIGTPGSDQFGTHPTLDSNNPPLNSHPTVSGKITSFNSRPTFSSKIIPADTPPPGSSLPPAQLPLVKIIIGQGIAITILLLVVIAFITHFSILITPNPSTSQTATPTPRMLYQADWSGGLDGWTGSADWKALNGQLANDGTKNIHNLSMPTIQVPFDLSNIPDYQIEARIQVTRTAHAAGFGFFVRYDNDGHGYIIGAGSPQDGPTTIFEITTADNWHTPLQQIDFTPGTAWHTYRIEAQQDHIMVFIDGGVVMDVTNTTYPSGAFVGLWDSNAQLSISSFVIESL